MKGRCRECNEIVKWYTQTHARTVDHTDPRTGRKCAGSGFPPKNVLK